MSHVLALYNLIPLRYITVFLLFEGRNTLIINTQFTHLHFENNFHQKENRKKCEREIKYFSF